VGFIPYKSTENFRKKSKYGPGLPDFPLRFVPETADGEYHDESRQDERPDVCFAGLSLEYVIVAQ